MRLAASAGRAALGMSHRSMSRTSEVLIAGDPSGRRSGTAQFGGITESDAGADRKDQKTQYTDFFEQFHKLLPLTLLMHSVSTARLP